MNPPTDALDLGPKIFSLGILLGTTLQRKLLPVWARVPGWLDMGIWVWAVVSVLGGLDWDWVSGRMGNCLKWDRSWVY
jgi:hypothetical protein